jgi:nucleoside-diphosphate kinase
MSARMSALVIAVFLMYSMRLKERLKEAMRSPSVICYNEEPSRAMGRTLLIIKPDAYRRGFEEAILKRAASAGMAVARSARRRLSREEVEELYREHRGKPFFEANADFLLSGEIGLFIMEGDGDSAGRMRRLVGNKDPRLAESGTIRGDFGIDRLNIERNLVHASANEEEAEREIALLFGDRTEVAKNGTRHRA